MRQTDDEIQDSGIEQCYFDEMLSQHQKARKYQRIFLCMYLHCTFILYSVYFATHAV